jgi:DNA-directed RNA polymerase subunit RPC12/RpoP
MDCYPSGDKVHLVLVICNPRANTDGETLGQTPLILSLQHPNQQMHSQQTSDAMCTCACASSLVPYAVTPSMMTTTCAAKRHSHCQHCNSCVLLESAGSASKLVPDAMTAAMMIASFAAKRHSHCQHCNSCVLLKSAGSAAGAGYNRSSSFQDVQDMKAFVKRLEQAELDKVQQRFQKKLQAAEVSYEVSVSVRQAGQCATYRLAHLLPAVWQ